MEDYAVWQNLFLCPVLGHTAEWVSICDGFSFHRITVFYYSSTEAKIGIILNKTIVQLN